MSTDNPMPVDHYAGYRGLPALVGLMDMKSASTHGLTITESVERLKRLHWALRRLHGIFVAHLASMPIYELKMAFSLHAHYCAEHVLHLAGRIREMRQPPYGLDNTPHPSLDIFFDEILAAPSTPALILGLYEHAIPAVHSSLEALLRDTSRLFDHPTYRAARFAQVEFSEICDYAGSAVHAMVTNTDRATLGGWSTSLQSILAHAGGLDGTMPHATAEPVRVFSAQPFHYNSIPQRDERFIDPYNMGVNAEAMLFNPEIPAQPKTLMLFFKRMREIDVPEMMSSILAETPGKPWEYYRDMTRQLWDEARHAMMGEVGFVSLGIDWRAIPFNFTWSLGLNTMLEPLERHAVLFTIEQGLMPKKNGKEYEWEVAVASANRLSELIQDYDWADEIVHAKVGRDWLVPQIGSQAEALAFGDKSWSRTLVDWAKWREDRLTDHRNWWAEVYSKACEHWGIAPDPNILAYNATYESLRPDMKEVSA
ncbi:hypothetical protein RBB79_00275 [Tunturiibacter empetritectus]|uniref:DUF455 family protein n=1 Tax=Tunturiibacter lichenicola TaxID=2051959 RepID=A0A852VM72_9BACT|nr:hypothetical protein [Edaphobacter lichenicola]NYF92261.1 hypothetical protein [Edaphobacter lichenicola]